MKFILFALASVLTTAILNAEGRKPNIILIYTDDHGWPDVGPQGIHNDLRTPHLDALAASGVLATNGYSSAPQCVPSRAGLMIGKYQNRFGVEANGRDLTGFDKEQTVAERLKAVGYTTAQIGKWHLGSGNKIGEHGFDYFYNKNANRPSWGNFDETGEQFPTSQIPHTEYHLDACSDAAVAFIRKQADKPFFLYLAYRAPHVPLDAPKKHLDRFPGEMAERRRQALAMIAAMDDGVGAIVAELKEQGLTENTLIFYIGDNGAPLKIHKLDGSGGDAFLERGFGGELFGMCLYRRGPWKILKMPPPYGTGSWQLYHVATDPGETTDRAAEDAMQLQRLVAAWEAYAAANGVIEPDERISYARPPR